MMARIGLAGWLAARCCRVCARFRSLITARRLGPEETKHAIPEAASAPATDEVDAMEL